MYAITPNSAYVGRASTNPRTGPRDPLRSLLTDPAEPTAQVSLMYLSEPSDPMFPQRRRHLDEHHGLVLIRKGLLSDLKLKVGILGLEVAEQDLDGLLLPFGGGA